MKLIIDIPDNEYENVKKSDNTIFADISEKECMLYAIKNGTPVPDESAEYVKVYDAGYHDGYDDAKQLYS